MKFFLSLLICIYFFNTEFIKIARAENLVFNPNFKIPSNSSDDISIGWKRVNNSQDDISINVNKDKQYFQNYLTFKSKRGSSQGIVRGALKPHKLEEGELYSLSIFYRTKGSPDVTLHTYLSGKKSAKQNTGEYLQETILNCKVSETWKKSKVFISIPKRAHNFGEVMVNVVSNSKNDVLEIKELELKKADILKIPLTEKEIHIDGRLRPKEWNQAANLFLKPNLKYLKDSEIKSKISFMCNDKYLYIAGIFDEPNMKKIVCVPSERDGKGVWINDALELFFGVGDDENRSVFHFVTNSLSGVYDSKNGNRKFNPQWDIITKRKEKKWIFEAQIPMNVLGMDTQNEFSMLKCNIIRNRVLDKGIRESYVWHYTRELYAGNSDLNYMNEIYIGNIEKAHKPSRKLSDVFKKCFNDLNSNKFFLSDEIELQMKQKISNSSYCLTGNSPFG